MYKTLSSYLREKYGGKIKKICIDGGFSCPNRDGKVGVGGCIYCGERGAGEHINPELSIAEQVKCALTHTSADGYIAYFQNFTNTYADIDTLKSRYDSALISDKIRILAIGTRPDCIDEDVCKLLLGYKSRVDVWVELGLQTANDNVAKTINRGYPLTTYLRAAELLKKYNIPFVTHMIIGLPGEDADDTKKTIDTINNSGSWGIKIHSIYVMRGTELERMYREKLYTPPTEAEYIEKTALALSMLNSDIVVHRITGDCPKDMLVAPTWKSDKNELIEKIRARYSALIKASHQ